MSGEAKIKRISDFVEICKRNLIDFPSFFTPQPLIAVRVLFSPMVSGWAGGQAAGRSLSGLYLRNHKVQEVDTW